MLKIVDMEVFNHDWLYAEKDLVSGERRSVWNDVEKVREWVNDENVYVTFNGKHYDQYIIKAILIGATPELVKELNDFIIGEGRQGFEHWFIKKKYVELNILDVRDDMQYGHSLKSIEGHFFEPIRESTIPFDLDRPLTESEKLETETYCWWDIDMTEKVFRSRKDYFVTKQNLSEEAGTDSTKGMSMTNAKLVAEYLGTNPFRNNDEREYVFPKEIDQERLAPQVEFFKSVWNREIPDDKVWEGKYETEIGGMPTVYGFGGVHGALLNYQEESNEEREILNDDVVSLYPSLMIVFGYISRAMKDPQKFIDTYDRRIRAKADGNKKLSDALKLVLNTTYGAMLNQYNSLYDPLMGRSVCITGQLVLTELLLDLLEIPSLTPINFNTDGIMYSVNRNSLEQVRKVKSNWEKRVGLKLEEEQIKRVVQKDVNNYFMLYDNGKVKTKGGYLVYGVPQAGAWSINNNIVGVKKAMVEYFLSGKPVREHIEENQNIFDFQIIAKAGGKYKEAYQEIEGEQVPVQKVNRVYAVKDQRFGKLIKVKAVDDSEAKIPSLPAHCKIDNENQMTIAEIDKEWYIIYAEAKVSEFLIGKQKKTRRKKEMATPTTPKTAELNPQLALIKKLYELQKHLDGVTWEKDGTNLKQQYKYIKESQYKTHFRKACITVGLLWKMETLKREYIPNISDKQHLFVLDFVGRLTDIDTGESESYQFSGTGADMGDKALYKAVTGGFKFFVASNFNVAEDNDPEADDPVEKEAPKYVKPETREAAKEELTSPARKATAVQIKAVKKILAKLLEKDPEQQELYDAIKAKTNDFTDITAEYAEEIIDKVSAALEGE